jgi:dCTP deaminase
VILSKPDILSYIKRKRLIFRPALPESSIAQVSVDLRLGRRFSVLKPLPGHIRSICVDASLWEAEDLWEHRETEEYILSPGKFVLARTLEEVCIPSDLVGLVEGRSSWARAGITVHVTAPKIDPGFDGPITLEMFNFSQASITLRAEKDMPAQLMFLRISEPLKKADLYGSKSTDIFQHQTDPVPRKKKKS